MTYKIRISPTIAYEMSACHESAGPDDTAYGWLKENNWPAGTFQFSEAAVNEFQSWAAFHTASTKEWLEYDSSMRGDYLAILAFWKQTVKAIGLRHQIG